ncbi:metallophosphoesterase [Lunatibacter salilacus]|uniref:metallophosphoesterase n=1 Tax=Lunatibacter salilacus TaxID=2483804 RepID=UPI00131E53DD|nr:metallophosphoesterase [Lunatibacter salilacus]
MKLTLFIFLGLFTGFYSAVSQQIRDNRPGFLIKPYLQLSTQTEMSLLWETTHPTTALIEFGKARFDSGEAILDQQVSDGVLKHMHELTMQSLEPETHYFYRVSSVTEAGDTLRTEILPFKTAVFEETPFAFTIFSDSQNNPEIWGKITALARDERPNFAIHGGDLVGLGYRKSEWVEEFFAPSYQFMKQIPIFSTLGNHEHDAAFYYQYMKNPDPEHYYSFKYGNAEFFMIDTDQFQEPGTPLYRWLEKALATSQATWKFVVQHHPPFSSEENDYGDTNFELSTYGDGEAKLLVPLFEKFGVDIVFSGHLHMYERTWPILDEKVVEKNGVRYLILGGSGGGLEKAAPNRTWFTNKVRTLHHYGYIAINGNQLQFQAIDQDGNLFDQFTLDGSRPKLPTASLPPTTPQPTSERRIFTNQFLLELQTAEASDDIYFTLDGSSPSRKSPRYGGPIELTESSTVKAIASNKQGDSPMAEYTFEKTDLLPAVPKDETFQSGLKYRYFIGKLTDPKGNLSDQLTLKSTGTIASLDPNLIPAQALNWGAELSGYLEIPESGYYTFSGHAYQLFRFYLHGELKIEEYNREVDYTCEVFLEKGLHPVRLEYYLPDRNALYWQFFFTNPDEKKGLVSDLNFYFK